jgi:hypothetical protein
MPLFPSVFPSTSLSVFPLSLNIHTCYVPLPFLPLSLCHSCHLSPFLVTLSSFVLSPHPSLFSEFGNRGEAGEEEEAKEEEEEEDEDEE